MLTAFPSFGLLADAPSIGPNSSLRSFIEAKLEISSLFVNYMICIKYYGNMRFCLWQCGGVEWRSLSDLLRHFSPPYVQVLISLFKFMTL